MIGFERKCLSRVSTVRCDCKTAFQSTNKISSKIMTEETFKGLQQFRYYPSVDV